jgi:DUF1680 family protein
VKNLALVLITGVAAVNAVAVDNSKVPYAEAGLDTASVTDIGGFVGQRMRASKDNDLKIFDIDHYVKMVEVPKQRDWWWIGEQPGKWLEASVWSSTEFNDLELEAKAKNVLARMEAAQTADGYLGITDPAVRTEAKPLRGMDPYELYFTLNALITAAQTWHDPKALETARQLGNYFVAHIGPGKAEFWPSTLRPPENKWKTLTGHSEIAGHSGHYSLEGTLLIEPMLRLYQATGDTNYLAWSQWVVGNIDKWSGWDTFSKLAEVADGKLPINEVQPYVHAHTFQMNFLGFLRLYEITGEKSLLRKVEGAWADVAKRQLYLTGGVSVGEHYEKGYDRPITGNVVETCATMSWLQLTWELLKITGDPKYADAMEKLLFNHVFASQAENGDCHRYHTPLNGFAPEGIFHAPDCCTSSGLRLMAMLPQFFYAQRGSDLFVNQFVSSSADFKLPDGKTITLRQATDYPTSTSVKITVGASNPVASIIHVRLPAWCQNPVVTVNGDKINSAKAGAYVELNRIWKSGDSIEVNLPMSIAWVKHDHFSPDALAPYALVRGPLVYALDTVWWDDKTAAMPYDAGNEVGVDRDASLLKVVSPTDGALGPFIQAPVGLLDRTKVQALMVPFANVGTWYRSSADKPDKNSRAFSYAVWLQDKDGEGFKRLIQKAAEQKTIQRESFDYVAIGNVASERAHKVAGTGHSGAAGMGMYHDANNGGWFSYELKVSPEVPSDLVVKYWGSDSGNRIFDILVNGKRIATQQLQLQKPDELFEVRYAIPFELIQGKTDDLGQKLDRITVKFQAYPGAIAGGIFGLRTVKQ